MQQMKRQSLATTEQAQKDLLESRIGVNEGDSIDAVDKELASLQDKVKKYGGDGNTLNIPRNYQNA